MITTDPMTGEPWTLCADKVTTVNTPHVTADGSRTFARCGGCGRPVNVNDKGTWEYVR